MALVVLKFGGTSLANTKLMNNAVTKVLEEIASGHKVIVVVSAMAGITDHLVSLTNEISSCSNIDGAFEHANVVTTGEQVSAGLFALLLQQKDIKARSWLGWQAGIITDDNVGAGEVVKLQCEQLEASFANGYQVAVVTGFQGVTESGRITTLGRGGSDTTAIILAGALKAQRCDIYTDVEGVFTADPRIVAKAQKLKSLNYDEMIEFADAGAKVLQTKSVKWAKHYQVYLRVLSSFTSNVGTLINNSSIFHPIVGIALSKDLQNSENAKISIIGAGLKEESLLKNLQQILKDNSVEVLSIQNGLMSINFIIKDEDKFNAIRYLHTACKLDEGYE